jgi:hypothetical protein
MINSRRVRWANFVASIGEMRNEYNILIEKKIKGRDHAGGPGIGERIKFELIFKKQGAEFELASSGPGYGEVAGSCEQGHEPLGSINSGEFPDRLKAYYFLMNKSASPLALSVSQFV